MYWAPHRSNVPEYSGGARKGTAEERKKENKNNSAQDIPKGRVFGAGIIFFFPCGKLNSYSAAGSLARKNRDFSASKIVGSNQNTIHTSH